MDKPSDTPYDQYQMALDAARESELKVAELERRVGVLGMALKPFAKMHREGCDLNELACSRGVASDLTIITSGDFANASAALAESATERGKG